MQAAARGGRLIRQRSVCNMAAKHSLTAAAPLHQHTAAIIKHTISGQTIPLRQLSSSASRFSDAPPELEKHKRGKRVWKAAAQQNVDETKMDGTATREICTHGDHHWDIAVDDVNDRRVVDESLSRICEQVSCLCF